MVVVGVLARVTEADRPSIRNDLDAVPGVTTFLLDDDLRLGILVEAPDAERAHAILQADIRTIPGVLGTWPVYMGEDHD